jgi:hypothetical protein
MYVRPDKFIWTLYKLPKNWKPYLAVLGYAIGYSLILERLIIVLEWMAITLKLDITGFYNIIKLFPFGRIDLVIIFIALNLLILLWFLIEYKKSRQLSAIRFLENKPA